jgi:hypothetical protein
MAEFDLEAACLVRLRQELGDLLAHAESECRERIMAMVCRRPREGLEIMPQLRAVLGPRLQRWPWPSAVYGGHTRLADDAGLEVEPLAEQPVATLWPYRPKREPDELFSSWLWRIARGLGAPPKRFAREVVGPHLTDIDRNVSDTAIERLPSCPVRRANIFCAGRCAPTSRLIPATCGAGSSKDCFGMAISC